MRLVAAAQHLADPRISVIARLSRLISHGLPPIFQDRSPRNEREVQNAVDGIGQAFEPELRRETPSLPFAGISTKPDFAKGEASRGWLFVEMKYPSTRTRVNGIVTEITSRIRIYTRQRACVLFAVYDPARHITNDDQFKTDIGGSDDVWVEIIR